MSNFISALQAIANDTRIITVNLFFAQWFWAFMCGVILSIILAAFITTSNPRHIPLILHYSTTASFQKIALRDKHGTYKNSFSAFIKTYYRIRLLSLIAFSIFCFMIIVAALTR